jgi:hypothetical protein
MSGPAFNKSNEPFSISFALLLEVGVRMGSKARAEPYLQTLSDCGELSGRQISG